MRHYRCPIVIIADATTLVAFSLRSMPTIEEKRTEFQMLPVFRPLGWLLEKLFVHRLMTAETRETVQNLKRIIESTNGPIGEDTHHTHER